MGVLKPFVINLNDLAYLLAQVNFVPLFNAPVNGDGIVGFDPATMDAWDAKGNKIWDHTTHSGVYQNTVLTDANVGLLGQGFPQVSSPIGTRDVTGYHNNLFGAQAQWGAVDVPFVRQVAADYTNYVSSPGGDYSLGNNVSDVMPRIISRTITTGGVNLLQDANGHFVEWSAAQYASDAVYKALINGSGGNIAQLVEGAKIIAPAGLALAWDAAADSASAMYGTLLAFVASRGAGDALYGPAGVPLTDGMDIFYNAGSVDNPTYVAVGVKFDATMLIYHSLVVESGVNVGGLANGDSVFITPSQINSAVADVASSIGAVVSTATATALAATDSGYGLLETIGHIDFQNPTSGEYFIGSENPGVAPVNSWFAIFGQFFDHGLDFIGKANAGKITIALDPSDPLYGTIGADGQPVTSIVVSRATPDSITDGVGSYVNHTSPFIDQSQTYGSNDQVTNVLRAWVSTDGGSTYHAGMNLFDGQTLEDSWTRRWPDGSTSQVHDTLPTLNELRAHLRATGRDDLTWEDVSNLRNRDMVTGDVIADGQPGAGLSGHALLLDMNPHFDGVNSGAGHISDAAIAAFNSQFPGANLTAANFSVMAILPYVNGDFSIKSTLTAAQHAAVSEILMQSVGDHYVAGDGRVNENFGLTSIHHVFHEEHNYQVENLKSWIYAHDANNPGAADAHEQLHNWQINTGTKDSFGNFLNGDGSIAWDPNKMFGATKLIVEMEYQHAAVDQYARTVTPRIQEFVGYSTGVDATVSLEYAQVAFRFGHSTIRETIDTIDPSGWYKGAVMHFALEKAFLAPQTFASEGVAAITLGLTRQQMNEVDEFVTPALTQGLLDQPLDLAAINIARGRDLGIPTLNDFRAGIGLAEYTSWADYGANMFHPDSLVNFIAAYSFGGDVAKAQFILDLADGAATPSGTDPFLGAVTATDAISFLNNNDGANTELNAARLGFDKIDSWIGGLAEAHVPGGLLGETFDAVFVAQIQALMDGDRFYYLYRLFGTQIHEEVNNGQFKDIVERNTGLTHLNGSIFAYADKYYDFTQDSDPSTPAIESSHAEHGYADLIASLGVGVYSDGGASTASNGTAIAVDGVTYIRDVRPDLHPDLVHPLEGTPTDGADSHEVLVGTQYRDYIHARSGDDTVYGEGGNDTIFGDGGVDRLYGGDGDDLIDTGEGPDLADGGAGKDTIYGRGSGSEVGGFDQLVGGSGNDLLVGGEGIDKLSGGSGDDIIYGDGLTNPEMGNTDPFTHGGDGNDYIDGGASGDLLFGEEGDDYLVGGNDQDLIQGGQGDDIIRPGNPSQASGTTGGPDEVVGDDGQINKGFDLVDFSDYAVSSAGVTVNFATQKNPLVNIDQTSTFPAWFQIEGAIGSKNKDTFIGDSAGDATADNSQGNNWLIGGSGNDTFQGNGGNDLIVGGSIRLDALVGKYADAMASTNLALGSAAWIAEAMTSGGGAAGYGNDQENAYTGASNRAAGPVSGGLLAGVNATIAGTANDYSLHFTEMLRSKMFRDLVLGDGDGAAQGVGGDSGTGDVAVFTGNSAKYSMVAYNAAGAIVANPHANWGSVFAIRVTDNRTAADLTDAAGAPLVDANGGPLVNDGSDLIVGVENFQFADRTVSARAYFDTAPALDLSYRAVAGPPVSLASDNFNGGYAGGTGWAAGPWTEAGDGTNASSSGQIQIIGSALRFGNGAAADGNNGAEIVRAVDLSGKSSATISFNVSESNFGSGESVTVLFAADGVNFTAVTNGIFNSATNLQYSFNQPFSFTVNAPSGGFSSAAKIKFAVTGVAAGTNPFNAHTVTIDNLNVTVPGPAVDGNPGTGFTTSYTEGAASTAIVATVAPAAPRIIDADAADTTIASAKIVLQNAVAGDVLTVGTLPTGIAATVDTSVAGKITVSLTGNASHAAYQAALQAIGFRNTGDDPTAHGSNTSRRIDVTVNDGWKDSNVAATTIGVTGIDDVATALVADRVVTNIGTGTTANNAPTITIPDWALSANDVDPDGVVISGVALPANSGLSNLGHSTSASVVTVRDITPGGGTFTYSSGAVTAATVTVIQDTTGALDGSNIANDILIGNANDSIINGNGGNDIILAGAGNDTINGGDGGDTIHGQAGDDIINAGTGNDTIVWAAANGGGFGGGGTDGWDVVNGGTETAGIGDRFVVNGNNQSETFRIYSLTDGNNDAEIDALLNNLGGVALNAASDILITRTVNGQTSIVAELSDVEEITINNQAVSTGGGNTAGHGSDTVQIVGDFSGTSLALNTITINGSSGDDTVDISGLTSDHRIVFNGFGGSDHVLGTVRPQDIVEISDASSLPDAPFVPEWTVARQWGGAASHHAKHIHGAQHDTFVFKSAFQANGGDISDFTAGDRIELSRIDADSSARGNNAFHLGDGTAFTSAGELIIHYDAQHDQTVVSGNTDRNFHTAEFEFTVQGNHVDDLKAGGIGL
jgi:hypothetical protein